MRTVLAKASLAFGLGVAASAAWAQADSANIPQPLIQQDVQTDTSGSASGAEVETDTSGSAATGQSGAGAASTEQLPATGGTSGEAAASGAAESGTGAEEQTGTAETTQQPTADGQAEQTQDEQPASGQPQQTTGTEQPASEDGSATAEDAQQPSNETTAAVNVTVEQKTEIRQIVREVNVEPVTDIDFEINVGVAVPRTIEFRPLPPRIIELVPAYRDYVFFVLADGRIVIVEPSSYEIVLIIV